MQILNIDELVNAYMDNERTTNAGNHELYPQHDEQGSFRWMIIGPPGTGKTNLLIDAIIQNRIKFDHIYLFARDPTQPKYKFLLKWLNEMEDRYRQDNGEDISMVTVETDPEKIPRVDDTNPEIINLVIFDDMLGERSQERIEEYWIRGRHRGCNCIYITQSYFDTPKKIRKMTDYFSIFALPSQNELIQLSKEHSRGMSNKLFKKLFHEATAQKHSFFHIDGKTENKNMHFRKGFDMGYDGDWDE